MRIGGRSSDLLIGNQMPTAQSQQINSFHDPATAVLPAGPPPEPQSKAEQSLQVLTVALKPWSLTPLAQSGILKLQEELQAWNRGEE